MCFLAGKYGSNGKNEAMAQLSVDSPPACTKSLELKLTHIVIAADVCRDPLQMPQPYCGKRPPGFVEIGIPRPLYLMCESLGTIQISS